MLETHQLQRYAENVDTKVLDSRLKNLEDE